MNNQERLASNLVKLPAQAYAVAPPGAQGKIVRLYRGETRYSVADHRMQSNETPEQAVERLNGVFEVTPAQREAMVGGSVFGFHTPAADTDSYNADGSRADKITPNTDAETMRDLLHEKKEDRKAVTKFIEWLTEQGHGMEFVEDLPLETLLDEYHGIDRERLTIEEQIVAAAR